MSGANRHDSMLFERCLDALPAVNGLSGRFERQLQTYLPLLLLAASIIFSRFIARSS